MRADTRAELTHDLRIEAILVPIEPSSPRLTADQAYARFAAHPGLAAIPLVEHDIPVGLVERHLFLTLYAGLYRRELYSRRDVGHMVDTGTVVIECGTSIHEAARIIAIRRRDQINIGFIVARDGRYAGVGNLTDLLRVVADLNASRAEEAERAERALRESEAKAAQAHARLSDAIESLSDAFFLWDADERLVLANSEATNGPGGERLRPGVRLEDFVVHRARAGYVPAAIGREDEYVRERLAQVRNATGEPVEVQIADGRWLSIRDRRTREGGVVNLIVDITAIKVHEAELSAARHAADAANRAKSDFLSRMSHELRTPLNAVIGFSQMLLLDRKDMLTEKQQGYCQDIENSGRHLLSLVNDVLDLARIESGNEEVSIGRVAVAEALGSLRAAVAGLAASSKVEVNVSVPTGVEDVLADDRRLYQVLLNLVSNASKYNRKGGAVAVSAHAVSASRVRFSVVDTGMGVPLDLQADLFEPFHRLGQEHAGIDGTGIGLSICKRLTEAMGGEIGFVSEPGVGSTFWIELPCDVDSGDVVPIAPAEQALRAPAERALRAPANAATGYSLLYVEDIPANVRLMTTLIQTLPHVRLLTAATPGQGLDLARTHRPDLIVLDLNLPGMSGYEILAYLKAMPGLSDTPVLALTAAATPSDVRRGLAAGFFRYLTKPFDVIQFLDALGECIPLTAEDENRRRAT